MFYIGLILMAPIFPGDRPEAWEEVNSGVQAVYDAVLGEDGRVDYAKLSKSPEHLASLDRFVSFAGRWDPDSAKNANEKIAILSNMYNVYTLAGVMKAWPVASVRKIRPFFGFFTKKEWRLGNQKISLNQIEKEHLRHLDPRIHFIINCASASCPVIQPRVLTAENVEAVMEAATRQFLNDARLNQFDRDERLWRLSKIFEWYVEDWGGRDQMVDFIQKYRPDLANWKPLKIEYLEYDWALNGPTD